MKRRRWRRFGLLFVWTLFVVCLALEIFLRYFFPLTAFRYGYSPGTPFRYDPAVGAMFKLGWVGEIRSAERTIAIQINAQGFRSDEAYRAGSADSPVIAVIGDSFVAAVQVPVEERFTDQLQQQLTETGQVIQVQNYGIPGLAVQDYLQLYRNHVRDFHPQYVVIVLTTANDIIDASPDLGTRPETDVRYVYDAQGGVMDVAPYRDPAGSWRGRVHLWLRRHLAIYAFADKLSRIKLIQDQHGLLKSLFVYEDPRQTVYEGAWQYSAWALEQIVAEVRADGAIPVLVILPPVTISDDAKWQQAVDQYTRYYDGALVRDRVRDDAHALMESLGVDVIDVSDSLRAACREGREPYLDSDQHLTAYGHDLVTAALYGYFG